MKASELSPTPRLILIGLVFWGCASAPAALVSINDPIHGPDSLTRDTDSGLEWLDLAVSLNRSYHDVSGQLNAGGEFSGFRHATRAEIEELFAHAGLRTFFTGLGAVTLFHDLFGAVTYSVGSITVTTASGMFDDANDGAASNRAGNAYAEWISDPSNPFSTTRAAARIISAHFDRSDSFPSVGHFLVRRAHPARPSGLDLIASSDSGDSNSDDITNDDTPTIAGDSPAGTTVALFSGDLEIGRGPSSGTFAIRTAPMAPGEHVITAVATYADGETSPGSAPLTIVIDTQSPEAPVGLDLAEASDDGVSNRDDTTSIRTPRIEGTAEDGSTVRLFANGALVGTKKSSGRFSIQTAPLSIGSYRITATATDAAGNTSAVSSALDVAIVLEDFQVTVTSASGQPYPVRGGPVRFVATFNRPAFGFDAGGVLLGGTASPTGARVTQIEPHDGTTWSITVTGMVRYGSVLASIPAGAAQDEHGNVNRASPNGGHHVTWQPIPVIPPHLISLDDAVHGRGSITRDTLTGLDWLDVTKTLNRSFASVSGHFSDDGEFAGFRHATGAEVLTLWTNAGILPAAFNDDTLMRHFHSLVGSVSFSVPSFPMGSRWIVTASGMFDDRDVGRNAALVGLGSAQLISHLFVLELTLLFEDEKARNEASETVGHWLVRDAPQPRLRIVRSGSSLLVTWDRVRDGAKLYQSKDLLNGPWTEASVASYRTNGATVTARVAMNSSGCFFQLREP